MKYVNEKCMITINGGAKSRSAVIVRYSVAFACLQLFKYVT
jgi:hypothetical protein